MKQWTLQEIRTKVEQDLDTEDELFIQPSELIGYINEAIDEAEANIVTLYEDYFLTRAPIFLVTGQNSYPVPGNIYADKVRGMEYKNGPRYYPMARFRNLNKFDRTED